MLFIGEFAGPPERRRVKAIWMGASKRLMHECYLTRRWLVMRLVKWYLRLRLTRATVLTANPKALQSLSCAQISAHPPTQLMSANCRRGHLMLPSP